MKKEFEYSLCFDYPEVMEGKDFIIWLKKIGDRASDFERFLRNQGEDCYVHFSDAIIINNDKDME